MIMLTGESLDKISYVDCIDSFIPSAANISNIVWKNNEVSATIEANHLTFVNFSQNMNRDWKAYIDGIETKILK